MRTEWCILTHHERGDLRESLCVSPGTGGRVAMWIDPEPRHRRTMRIVEGPTAVPTLHVLRVMGRTGSWSTMPQRGDQIVGQSGGTWLDMRVLAAEPWHHGKCLDLIVRIVDRRPITRTRGRRRIAAAAAWAVGAMGAMLAMEGRIMAEGTYAEYPRQEMDQFLGELGQWPAELRRDSLPLIAEAVLSEAQARSPVRWGTLQGSHTVGDRVEGLITIGANTDYALAVHETHKTKRRWFLRAILQHFPRIARAQLEHAARQKGAR